MKVQCDVCSREEASVFCCADEAALCAACDGRVHRANKLAGKHRRIPLLPSADQPHPICDVCQEKRGFVFCQEDRAILCKDCDASIHTANHLTMKHSRFLLTGARLSSSPITTNTSSPASPPEEVDNTSTNRTPAVPKTNQDQPLVANSPVPSTTTTATSTTSNANSSSSISDYLIKMLPGWGVEDLLVDDAAAAAAAAANGFRQGDELLPFLEAGIEGGVFGAAAEEFPIWVPHVPQVPPPHHSSAISGGAALHYRQSVSTKAGRERWSDDAFTVPQIPLGNSKRARASSLWYY